ncbi:MAG: methyltransferase domain-containing protein [Bacteroidales bacterium]|nr:MAG: methyltransferase domain-containing protein [Bacteroidales bacterium]
MKNYSEYPDFIARFYDIIYEKVRTGVDNDFFVNKASRCKGKILELGVGTGRLYLDALKKGADIYGIDVSPSMIKVLHQKMNPAERYRVWVQDAVRLETDMRFDLIIAPFRMFSHVIEIEDQLMLLNRVEEHLNPGGQFIFDLFIPNLRLLQEGINQFRDFEGEYEKGKKLHRIVSAKSDLLHQITHVEMTLGWDEGGEEVTKTWHFNMRFFFRYEIEHLIHRSNLELIKIFGDYSEGELGPDSNDFIVLCGKGTT